jgi:hypothetical protein
MTINSGAGGRPSNGSAVSSSQDYNRTGRLEKKKDSEEKKEKKRGFFSSGKK